MPVPPAWHDRRREVCSCRYGRRASTSQTQPYEHRLAEGGASPGRILELGSYHAIVACVGSGTGIALMPESVLDTLPLAEVQRHRLPAQHARIVTPLIWRSREQSRALVALRDLLERRAKARRGRTVAAL